MSTTSLPPSRIDTTVPWGLEILRVVKRRARPAAGVLVAVVLMALVISFATPDDQFPPASVTLPTVNLFLYDAQENRDLRDREPVLERQPSGRMITVALALKDRHPGFIPGSTRPWPRSERPTCSMDPGLNPG